MRCERYWKDGVLLVEQGRPDPHRDECLDCRREHEARGELVRAFELVGARGGNPRWQSNVLRAIEEKPSAPWYAWAGALAAACLVAVVAVPRLRGGEPADTERPRIEIVPSEIAMRSTAAGIGDRVRVRVRATDEARIYRGDRLLLRCTADTPKTAECAREDGGLRAEHVLALPGEYRLVIMPAGIAEPAGSFDRDLAAITAGGSSYEMRELAVR
ncbi:MAG TPA: hypothetical protein VNO30_48100 [Kofleriaceae bacterium]|nr:hypothetical protein [Kofleriaceae bacterium]